MAGALQRLSGVRCINARGPAIVWSCRLSYWYVGYWRVRFVYWHLTSRARPGPRWPCLLRLGRGSPHTRTVAVYLVCAKSADEGRLLLLSLGRRVRVRRPRDVLSVIR